MGYGSLSKALNIFVTFLYLKDRGGKGIYLPRSFVKLCATKMLANTIVIAVVLSAWLPLGSSLGDLKLVSSSSDFPQCAPVRHKLCLWWLLSYFRHLGLISPRL